MATRAAQAEFFQNKFRWAKSGKGGLDEINADEPGEEEPPGINEVAEGDTKEHEASGENANGIFYSHGKGELSFSEDENLFGWAQPPICR